MSAVTERTADRAAVEPAPVAARDEPSVDRAAVEDSLADLPARYRPAHAPRTLRRYRLTVAGATPHVVVADGASCVVYPSRTEPVDAALRTDPATWLAMVEGARSPLEAFLDGALEIAGDLNEALRLETLFDVPDGSPMALSPARIGRYDVSGANLATFETGPLDAPTMLMIHGLGASKVSLLPAIAGMSRTHRAVAVDLPGFGKSTTPVGARYDARYFADVLLELLEALGDRPVDLIGNSLGGRVALEMALRAPERVRGLGLLCPAVAFDAYRLVRPALAATRGDLALGLAAWPLPRRLVDRGLRRLFADHGRVPADNLRAAREDFLRTTRAPARRRALLAAGRHLALERPQAFWRRLGDLAVPSLWVFGDRDPLVPCRYAEQVARHAPADAVVEIWDSSGHVPQFEHPQRTVAALRRAFTGQEHGVAAAK